MFHLELRCSRNLLEKFFSSTSGDPRYPIFNVAISFSRKNFFSLNMPDLFVIFFLSVSLKKYFNRNNKKTRLTTILTQELSKTYPQNFCMSPNLFKLAWMKDPYGYMNLPEYGFPQGPYSPARAISKIGVYFGSKFSNCHIGLGFNLRSISFNV